MARLAALVPRPRHHLVRFHGVFAPNAKLRTYVVPRPPPKKGRSKTARNTSPQHHNETSPAATAAPQAPLTWAERLKRIFGMDITKCPKCGGTLRVIADVTDPDIISRILEHVRAQGATNHQLVPVRWVASGQEPVGKTPSTKRQQPCLGIAWAAMHRHLQDHRSRHIACATSAIDLVSGRH